MRETETLAACERVCVGVADNDADTDALTLGDDDADGEAVAVGDDVTIPDPVGLPANDTLAEVDELTRTDIEALELADLEDDRDAEDEVETVNVPAVLALREPVPLEATEPDKVGVADDVPVAAALTLFDNDMDDDPVAVVSNVTLPDTLALMVDDTLAETDDEPVDVPAALALLEPEPLVEPELVKVRVAVKVSVTEALTIAV